MEGVPKTEVIPAVDQVESNESYAEVVAEAHERLANLKVYEGQTIVDRAVWTAVEDEAANLSTILATIPEEVRVANNLPGGRIYAPAANDERVALAS
jgi:hypothetical protein